MTNEKDKDKDDERRREKGERRGREKGGREERRKEEDFPPGMTIAESLSPILAKIL